MNNDQLEKNIATPNGKWEKEQKNKGKETHIEKFYNNKSEQRMNESTNKQS